MIKPFYKSQHIASIVEVEEYCEIDLRNLPIKVYPEEGGYYEIGWAGVFSSDETNGEEVLSEYGRKSPMSFGGRKIGVIRIIE